MHEFEIEQIQAAIDYYQEMLGEYCGDNLVAEVALDKLMALKAELTGKENS